ncbi:DUF433 domain-containing protein [Halobacterium noricense]|uniref:DUF433 domain-containing protein n=1 Tax=Halobacterium noricense TaxID=223182 RepID=UPI001E29288C|nr:DUF433 domain-containing protein [Halobacterium noricense]UHH26028.1 DUF433 domain-containing protein [Halobacterium noricense]
MSTQVRRVVSGDDSDIHDEPHIKGRRVTVQHIHERVEGHGLDPETVANRLNLSLSEIYHALAYYHDHPEEMRAVEEERERVREMAENDSGIATGPEDAPQ